MRMEQVRGDNSLGFGDWHNARQPRHVCSIPWHCAPNP